jgi:hypothetical protein
MRRSFSLAALTLSLALSSAPAVAQEKQQHEQQASGGTAVREDGQALTAGWNIVHAAGCFGSVDSNGVPVTALFGKEGNTTWFTAAPNAAMIMAAACQTGNFVGFHVVDAAGTWNAIFSVPGK